MTKYSVLLNERLPIINLQDGSAIYFIDGQGKKQRICWMSWDNKGKEEVILNLPMGCFYVNEKGDVLSREQVKASVLEILKYLEAIGIYYKTNGVVFVLQGTARSLKGTFREEKLAINLLKLPVFPYNHSLALFQSKRQQGNEQKRTQQQADQTQNSSAAQLSLQPTISAEFKVCSLATANMSEFKDVKDIPIQELTESKTVTAKASVATPNQEKTLSQLRMLYSQLCGFIERVDYNSACVYLHEEKVSPNPPAGYTGKLGPPLAIVCENFVKSSHLDIMNTLLANGADVNALDPQGNSILQRAVSSLNDNSAAIALLLDHGAILSQGIIDLARTILNTARQKKYPTEHLVERLALLEEFNNDQESLFKLILRRAGIQLSALLGMKLSVVTQRHLFKLKYGPLQEAIGPIELVGIIKNTDPLIVAALFKELNYYHTALTSKRAEIIFLWASRATDSAEFINNLELLRQHDESQIILLAPIVIDLTKEQMQVLADCRKLNLRISLIDLQMIMNLSKEVKLKLFAKLSKIKEPQLGYSLTEKIQNMIKEVNGTCQFGPVVLALLGKYFIKDLGVTLANLDDSFLDNFFKAIGRCVIDAILRNTITISDEILECCTRSDFRAVPGHSCSEYNSAILGSVAPVKAHISSKNLFFQNAVQAYTQNTKAFLLRSLENLTEEQIVRIFDRATNTLILLNQRLAGLNPTQNVFPAVTHIDMKSAVQALIKQEHLHDRIRSECAKSEAIMYPLRLQNF